MPVLGPQVLGEEHDKMYRHHHRNQTRLLPQETFEVSDSVPVPCYSHVLCGLVMWSSSNVRVCYVGYSFLTIITIRRYFFSSNLTCVGYSWYGLICESDLASVIFQRMMMIIWNPDCTKPVSGRRICLCIGLKQIVHTLGQSAQTDW